VNWIGVPSLKDALEKVRQAAKNQAAGSWIIVAGGWTEEQFSEKRRPMPQEMMEASGGHPVYVQHLYDGPCSRPPRCSSSTSGATPMSRPAESFRWMATSQPA
jgi:Amidohydrolase family